VRVAVIVAGGTGERFGAPAGKQLARIDGRPVLSYTLTAISSCPSVDGVVLVANPERLGEYQALAEVTCPDKLIAVVPGGESRQLSVASGLGALPRDARIVIIHDGARPLVTSELITRAVDVLEEGLCEGVIVGHPAFDTLKRVTSDGVVVGTADRSELWSVQTPQVFLAEVLQAAYAEAERAGLEATDDAALVEAAGGTVRVILGARENIKITVAEDVALAEAVVASRRLKGES
jgi:2-C-methyl-D-erythritol 4-phosphate cytidylyltransferase